MTGSYPNMCKISFLSVSLAGVSPLWLVTLGSAPCCSKIRHIVGYPRCAAQCSAVQPLMAFRALMSTPDFNSFVNLSASPIEADSRRSSSRTVETPAEAGGCGGMIALKLSVSIPSSYRLKFKTHFPSLNNSLFTIKCRQDWQLCPEKNLI